LQLSGSSVRRFTALSSSNVMIREPREVAMRRGRAVGKDLRHA
jgi:hypothetical protein